MGKQNNTHYYGNSTNEGAKEIVVKNKKFTERRKCTTDTNRGSPVGPT